MVLGLLLYAITQGAAFVVLSYLPAITVNLLWSFSTVTITLLGVVWLAEKPTGLQWGGILVAVAGAVVYFYPAMIPRAQVLGVPAGDYGHIHECCCSDPRPLHKSVARISRLARHSGQHGCGRHRSAGDRILVDGVPAISAKGWAIILWLAVVNTAFAFTVWNHTMRSLTAMEFEHHQ